MFGWSQVWPHQLRRAFDLIVFDWDGTAVADRDTRSPGLAEALEKLLSRDAICCVITGTKLQNIDAQILDSLSPAAKERLFLFTNRGSEVYSFGADGKIGILSRRVATEEENRALDDTARAVKEYLARFGLEAEIVSDRLNRRKIDVIPVARWRDPRKSEFGELLHDVQARLGEAGVPEGLNGVVQETWRQAERSGLSDPRITSDIKHIEVGLTDKSDSIRWIREHIIGQRGIPVHQSVFIGDEFGTVGGFMGSDALMRSPELKDAVYASVGVEPEGAPEKVLHIGGGPKRFLDFLIFQGQLRTPREHRRTRLAGELLRLSADPAWLLKQEGFDPSREREVETLFSLGNGVLGARGSAELTLPAAQSDLFIAGVYSKKSAMIPYSELEFSASEGRDDPYSEMVPFPSPFRVGIRVDGDDISFESTRVRNHERVLDFRKGLLFQTFTFEDRNGRRTRLQSVRCISVADPHLMLHEIEVVCENHSGRVELELAPEILDPELRYPHLTPLPIEKPSMFSQMRVYDTGSPSHVCVATRAFSDAGPILNAFVSTELKAGEPLRVRRFISVFCKRPPDELVLQARRHLFGKSWRRFDRDLDVHESRWETFWSRCDLRFKEDPSLTQAQRFNSYHLRISADHNPETSVTAKALTGRAYEGHIFWDTEIFLLPFFNRVQPDIARNLLTYRYNTLGGARRRARGMGCAGACFAWESTVTGDDVTPRSITIAGTGQAVPIFTGEQQIHVTGDVAFGLWQYWELTRDRDFMIRFGAEILFETARFWSTRARQGSDGRLHILKVVGPDEYHSGVNDNAFTNWMARFNLEKAAETAEWMQAEHPLQWGELIERLRIERDEPAGWRSAARSLFIQMPGKDGVIEQFEGFFRLKDVHLQQEERNKAPVSRLFKWQEINGMKVIKQADVLMIPFLFPSAFSREIVRANYEYYERVTDHGSSLSPSVHSAIAALVGDREASFKYWEQSLFLDLRNTMHNTGLGIHIACIGGAWQALTLHALGGRVVHGEVSLNDIHPRRAA